MATVYEIPTSPTPQTFSITLSGKPYRLTLKWNVAAQVWVLDIAATDGVPVLVGVPIVTGADLLEQYGYLEFAGMLFAMTDNDPDLPPGFNDLGQTGRLYWVAPQ